jgi:hypothetical protein
MKKIIFFVPVFLIIMGCADGGKDAIKNQFCGVHISAQYCKCAFHNEFCGDIGMTKSEAKKYVYDEYDKWQNGGKEEWANECQENNGIFFGNTCMQCKQDEVADQTQHRCVKKDEVTQETEPQEEVEENNDEVVKEDKKEGSCEFDSDCSTICEGDVMWKMGCNPRTGECIKTFDTNCSADVEQFGELTFPKICQSGKCIRDTQSIEEMRTMLQGMKKESIKEGKLTIAQRQELQTLMLEANKNCLNGIADMTNVAIVEFGTRIASLMAGGLPGLADVSVDYVNDAINKLSAQSNDNLPEEKKLKPDEYIKLNCGLYNHFKNYLDITASELDNEIDNAKEVDDMLQLLPK